MKTRYTVIDHKTNMKHTYTKWQWELAFALIFITGIGTGSSSLLAITTICTPVA